LGGKPVRSGEWPAWPPPLPSAETGVEAAIKSGVWVRQSGRYTIEFEQAFAAMLGVRQALTVCSGTGALNYVMRAMDIGPGDEVLVTPFTFHTGASIPLLNYALPVFVDIDPESLQMDPAGVAARAGADTRAMIVCHWGGQAADMDGMVASAKKHKLQLCEDAYQSLPGLWRGKALGSIGDIGLIGHHENEILPCGEGATRRRCDPDQQRRGADLPLLHRPRLRARLGSRHAPAREGSYGARGPQHESHGRARRGAARRSEGSSRAVTRPPRERAVPEAEAGGGSRRSGGRPAILCTTRPRFRND
jgi:hypothetical protein